MPPITVYAFKNRPGVVRESPERLTKKVATGLHWDKLVASLRPARELQSKAQLRAPPQCEAALALANTDPGYECYYMAEPAPLTVARATPSHALLIYRTTTGELKQEVVGYKTLKLDEFSDERFEELEDTIWHQVGHSGEEDFLLVKLLKRPLEIVQKTLAAHADGASGDLYLYAMEGVLLFCKK